MVVQLSKGVCMKISPIQSSVSYLRKSSNPSFRATLKYDDNVEKRMDYEGQFRDVMNQFKGWLTDQEPRNGVVNIAEKPGQMVQQLVWRGASSPEVEWRREDLEISLGHRKLGFYYNSDNRSEVILEDLKRTFKYLK